MSKKSLGFTIVELLIVIVVIGILASVIIIAFQGVRESAMDAKRASAIDQYVKILKMYQTKNGELPTEVGCLGEEYNYPATGRFPAGVCEVESPSRMIRVNNDLNDKLRTVSPTLPDVSGSSYEAGDEFGTRGMWLSDGKLIYMDKLKNGLSCPKGDLERYQEGIAFCTVEIRED